MVKVSVSRGEGMGGVFCLDVPLRAGEYYIRDKRTGWFFCINHNGYFKRSAFRPSRFMDVKGGGIYVTHGDKAGHYLYASADNGYVQGDSAKPRTEMNWKGDQLMYNDIPLDIYKGQYYCSNRWFTNRQTFLENFVPLPPAKIDVDKPVWHRIHRQPNYGEEPVKFTFEHEAMLTKESGKVDGHDISVTTEAKSVLASVSAKFGVSQSWWSSDSNSIKVKKTMETTCPPMKALVIYQQKFKLRANGCIFGNISDATASNLGPVHKEWPATISDADMKAWANKETSE